MQIYLHICITSSFCVVMEIHREIWNNDILRPELPLSLFNSKLCRVYTTAWVLKMELAASSQKPELIQRGLSQDMIYEKKEIWKRWDHHLCLSAVSFRPLYQLEEKHHQIRAYILMLIKVIAVRHLQIMVPSCQVDSISAVRHLVWGISTTLDTGQWIFSPTVFWRFSTWWTNQSTANK